MSPHALAPGLFFNFVFCILYLQVNPPTLAPGLYHLPPGPLLLSPTNFITGFITEVSPNQLD